MAAPSPHPTHRQVLATPDRVPVAMRQLFGQSPDRNELIPRDTCDIRYKSFSTLIELNLDSKYRTLNVSAGQTKNRGAPVPIRVPRSSLIHAHTTRLESICGCR